MFCNKCGTQLPADSTFCTRCGAAVVFSAAESVPPAGAVPPIPPGAAAAAGQPQVVYVQSQSGFTANMLATLLSFFIPGLGQMVTGRIGAGLAWLVFTCIGYMLLVVPGIVLHILCLVDAWQKTPPKPL